LPKGSNHVYKGGVRGTKRLVLATVPVLLMAGIEPASPPRWEARYDGPAGGFDEAFAIVVSPDGRRVFVAGESEGNGFDFATVAYDAATGAELWTARYDGPAGGSDWAYGLAVSPDGAWVFVTGPSQQEADLLGPADYATVAYDAATGTELWVARYDGPVHDEDSPFAVAVSSDGGTVVVTGTSDSTSSNNDYLTVAYDATSGDRLWVSRYDGPRHDRDTAYQVVTGLDGRAYVTGFSVGRGDPIGYEDYATVAYDLVTGTRLWAARYDGPGGLYDVAYDLTLSPDGSRVFVTGTSVPDNPYQDFATVAYDADTGTELWATLFSGRANGYDLAFAVGVGPAGSSVFVAGSSGGGPTGDDMTVVSYDAATGGERWRARYDGGVGQGDTATDLVVSPTGSRVYVAGRSSGPGFDEDYATLAFRASSGARLWTERHDGPAGSTDVAEALAVSPDGRRVYVTGYSDGGASNWDYGTVAYRA
jgi:DNA-binding beta-propeller fold protein YncE